MIINMDCIDYIKTLPSCSIDSVVTDPPYSINFMEKDWDKNSLAFSANFWKYIYDVLKPGGYILSFGGTRTYHRMAIAIEDAGFEIRDVITWHYKTGMPHGTDVSKQIEAKLTTGSANTQAFKTLDGEKGVTSIGYNKMKLDQDARPNNYNNQEYNKKVYLHTEEAQQWEGWNTTLKPATEFICMARKPLSENTVAENVLVWGTGAINIDACRIEHEEPVKTTKRKPRSDDTVFNNNTCGFKSENLIMASASPKGRFPTNVIAGYDIDGADTQRFFFVPKASKKERGEGNNHPTVKPIQLMEYLIQMVTPKNGTVLDPFMGSGTTGIACKNKNYNFVGIENNTQYFNIARKRIEG